jgi:hypothetical protein
MMVFFIGALGLGYQTYRRLSLPIQLIQRAVTVDGNITEKLVQSQRLSPLPVNVPTYVVRYTFPNLQGQMRTGEQIVTRPYFDALGEQGAPTTITLYPEDNSINAIDPRFTFPAASGVYFTSAIICLITAYLILLFGVMEKRSSKR